LKATPTPKGCRPGAPALIARLGQLVCEADEIAIRLHAEPLTEADGLRLAGPAGHAQLVADMLADLCHWADDCLDLSFRDGDGYPPRPAVELREAA
jgi:hypothetical protein